MILSEVIYSYQVEHRLRQLATNINFRRAFPLLRFASFSKTVTRSLAIVEEETEKGLILKIIPAKEFQKYGDRELLLMIYPEYQRRGIGTKVLDHINEGRESEFFVSSKANPSSTAFFQKQQGLKLVDDTQRFSVYLRC
jgi:GNAT superfamily N-acetyltransferase